jgi:hypothetical protein
VAVVELGVPIWGFKVAQSKMEKWIYSTAPLGTKVEGVPEWLRK